MVPLHTGYCLQPQLSPSWSVLSCMSLGDFLQSPKLPSLCFIPKEWLNNSSGLKSHFRPLQMPCNRALFCHFRHRSSVSFALLQLSRCAILPLLQASACTDHPGILLLSFDKLLFVIQVSSGTSSLRKHSLALTSGWEEGWKCPCYPLLIPTVIIVFQFPQMWNPWEQGSWLIHCGIPGDWYRAWQNKIGWISNCIYTFKNTLLQVWPNRW